MFDFNLSAGLFNAAINMDNVTETLLLMGKGMLGILLVMAVMYIVIAILNAATGRKKDKNKSK